MNKGTDMTYRELLDILSKMPDDRLDDTVTAALATEYVAIERATISDEDNDVLDPGHLVLVVAY